MYRLLLWLIIFLAVTAIAGGLGILFDLVGLPEQDLDGSPFSSYVIPGLSLLILVGGSALVAAYLLWRREPSGAIVAADAGAAIMIFEIVQVRYIPFHFLQIVYFVLGAVIFALSVVCWLQMRADTR